MWSTMNGTDRHRPKSWFHPNHFVVLHHVSKRRNTTTVVVTRTASATADATDIDLAEISLRVLEPMEIDTAWRTAASANHIVRGGSQRGKDMLV